MVMRSTVSTVSSVSVRFLATAALFHLAQRLPSSSGTYDDMTTCDMYGELYKDTEQPNNQRPHR
ncbi:hypothetical protein D9C73_009044 [Collichthys lucidus]|uniref:Uncharacterized protein n=1 Tax=Collichthys lucidus TaxID=240159 RepID=A0A4U5UKZ7_COLLU|nr:hypothetical protein D9C73_009044 [Collichthys lucidus]